MSNNNPWIEIKRLEAANEQLKQQLFKADTAARTIQENGAATIKELREALHSARDAYDAAEKVLAQTQAKLAATEEALTQVQKESAELREKAEAYEDRHHLLQAQAKTQQQIARMRHEHERAEHHLRNAAPDETRAIATLDGLAHAARDRISVLRSDLNEARDTIARAFTQLHVAFPDSPNDPAHLVGIAIHARDTIGILRADREDANQNRIALQQECNAATATMREIWPHWPYAAPLSMLAVYARDRIAELQSQCDQNRHDLRNLDRLAGDRLREIAADKDALVNALREVEWEGAVDDSLVGRCMECARLQSDGHTDDCKVARALDGRASADMMRDLDDLRRRLKDASDRASRHRVALDQAEMNTNVAYTILREAFPRTPKGVGLDTLVMLARAAVERIADLERDVALAADQHTKILQERERAIREKAVAVKLVAEARRDLEAARQVANAAGRYDQAREDYYDHRDASETGSLEKMRLGGILQRAHTALFAAVRVYREHNHQTQGENTMPTIQEVADEMAQTAPSNLTATAEAERSQTALEAEMKRRLDAMMAEGGEDAGPSEKGLDNLREDAKTLAEKLRELSEPATTQAPTGGPQSLTPETAPAGARILIGQPRWTRNRVTEVTVLEWAPSGQAVKLRWPNHAETWERDLLEDAMLLETLPKQEPHPLAKVLARRMVQELTGHSATHTYNLHSEGRSKAECLDSAIQQLEELKRRAQEQEQTGAQSASQAD
jgi:hypothetical protein